MYASESHFFHSPHALLENQLIRDYLLSKGYSIHNLHTLPNEAARSLMIEACQYAALKLTEIESRAKFRQKIHYPA